MFTRGRLGVELWQSRMGSATWTTGEITAKRAGLEEGLTVDMVRVIIESVDVEAMLGLTGTGRRNGESKDNNV